MGIVETVHAAFSRSTEFEHFVSKTCPLKTLITREFVCGALEIQLENFGKGVGTEKSLSSPLCLGSLE